MIWGYELYDVDTGELLASDFGYVTRKEAEDDADFEVLSRSSGDLANVNIDLVIFKV